MHPKTIRVTSPGRPSHGGVDRNAVAMKAALGSAGRLGYCKAVYRFDPALRALSRKGVKSRQIIINQAIRA